MTGASVNIVDAYKDPRFDSSFDTRENYKTKTILSLPLRDHNNNIICVVQALNKIDGIFTPDDEALFELLSAHCVIVLQRVIKNETINLTLNRLRLSLEACVRMSKCDSLVEFSREMQRECKFVMNTDQAYFYYVDADQLCIVKDDTIEKFPLNMGLVGKSAKEGCLMNIKDAYNNPCFNGKVDIDTTLPVLCIPFKKETGEVIAVIEMLNTKSIRVQASISESKLNQVDSEIFEYFERIVTIFLNRYLYSNKP